MNKIIKISLLLFTFSSMSHDYNLVLLGQDSENDYCFSAIKLKGLKEYPQINHSLQITKLVNKSNLIKILEHSIYSNFLRYKRNRYSLVIEPQRNSSCYLYFKKAFENRYFIQKQTYKLGTYLANKYYSLKDYFYPPKQDKLENNQLIDLLGNDVLFLEFIKPQGVRFYCACIIKEDKLYDSILEYMCGCIVLDDKVYE